MDPGLKVLNLGLVTMNVVGEEARTTPTGPATPEEAATEPTIGRSAPATAVGGSTERQPGS